MNCAKWILVLTLSCNWACLFGQELAQPPAMSKGLLVSVDNVSCDERALPIFDWKISNPTQATAFIYATFLHGPAASWQLDSSTHVFTVWSSLPNKADYAVNDYPRARFLPIKAGETISGRYIGRLPKQRPCSSCGQVPKEAASLVFAVAFGWSTDSVESQLRTGNYVHPANPIVDWQIVSRSPPVRFHECGAR